MQPTNLPQSEPQPREENLIRIIGHYFGRVIATVSAAITARLTHNHYAGDLENQTQLFVPTRIIREIKQDASVAAASVFTWNSQIGGASGADASEYMVDRISNLATRSLETPLFPKSTVTVADRVTDNLLWRFTKHAFETVPEVRSVLQDPPDPQRREGRGFYF